MGLMLARESDLVNDHAVLADACCGVSGVSHVRDGAACGGVHGLDAEGLVAGKTRAMRTGSSGDMTKRRTYR